MQRAKSAEKSSNESKEISSSSAEWEDFMSDQIEKLSDNKEAI